MCCDMYCCCVLCSDMGFFIRRFSLSVFLLRMGEFVEADSGFFFGQWGFIAAGRDRDIYTAMRCISFTWTCGV